MTAIILDPLTSPVVQRVPDTQQGLDAFCGGATRLLPFPLDAAGLLYLTDIVGQTQNRLYRRRWYYGRMLIVGVAALRLISLTAEQQSRYCRMFAGADVAAENIGGLFNNQTGGHRA